MKWPKPLFDALDQATRMAPILVVGALAAYTWWLVQSTPSAGSGRGLRAASTVPDYVLHNAVIERFDEQGQRVSVLRGVRMSHVVEGDKLTVEQPRLVGLDPDGQRINAVATLGHYMASADQVDLQGQARVVMQGVQAAQGPLVFESESVAIDVRQRQIQSDVPVVISRSDGVVRASAMHHNGQTGVTDLSGRVNGQLAAQRR
jgi:lipopolysaccharide export system protein LptC